MRYSEKVKKEVDELMERLKSAGTFEEISEEEFKEEYEKMMAESKNIQRYLESNKDRLLFSEPTNIIFR